ncbi:hypothetical protein N8987_03825 [Crocinitomix sp.]|nr:hypothetical protein [Crocinitomix sp.]
MKQILGLIIFLLSWSSTAQVGEHVMHWQDSYTIQRHITEYINNVFALNSPILIWDDTQKKYISYLPMGLTNEMGRGKSYIFEAAEIHLLKDYFKGDLANITEEKLNAIMDTSRKVMTGVLYYDEKGRVKEVTRTVPLYDGHSEEHKALFEYSNTVDGLDLHIVITAKEYQEKAHYSSKYVGNIMRKPLLLESTWTLNFKFNAEGELIYGNQQAMDFANGKINSEQGQYEYWFDWNEQGRMISWEYAYPSLQNTEEAELGLGVSTLMVNDFELQPFEFTKALETYPLLYTPSINKWLINHYDTTRMTLLHSKVGSDVKTELLYDGHIVLMELDSTVIVRQDATSENGSSLTYRYMHGTQKLYDRFQDSIGEYIAAFDIRYLPNLNDNVPYDPDYYKKIEEKGFRVIDDPDHPHRQPGLIQSMYGSRAGRSELKLGDGWKMIAYRLGTDMNYNFALGHRVPIRQDILQDKYVILDENDVVQFYYTYGKLYRITEMAE